MCGVIGLVHERSRPDLGAVAAELLETLEYRGYDSTGAAVQGDGEDFTLVKGVGAPSVLVDDLGIRGMEGAILCAQVRWATFGAVDRANAQPHRVACKTALYGAHNGNVTNCDDLKTWLQSEGHRVLSDNDGEMVVHTIEHFFDLALVELGNPTGTEDRRRAMRRAIRRGGSRLRGSYAAVIVDPVSRTVWAIKAGSSLYCGVGADSPGGPFAIASSDLSAVLRMTRVLVPMKEGEAVEMTPEASAIFQVAGDGGEDPGLEERPPVRSRLHAKDTALLPPFETFMDQEISAQEENARALVTLFRGGSEATRALGPLLDDVAVSQLEDALDDLRHRTTDDDLREGLAALLERDDVRSLLPRVPAADPEEPLVFSSPESGLFEDLAALVPQERSRAALRLFDAILERREVAELEETLDRFVEMVHEALDRGGRVFAVCCGSSYHAARAGALFFNEIARIELLPVLPGEYRGQHRRSLVDGDLFLAISQSGETKDLIDVLDDVAASGRRIRRAALVNNLNSTLAQEKADLVLPLRCGPEIAVPATKSFMNQMVLFYCLALRLARARVDGATQLPETEIREMREQIDAREDRLARLPDLIRETVASTDADVEQAARLLHLRPSIQILATRILPVALEGALKIREVVLNHTEGFEGSEFKHGPNTILGFNTVLGPERVDALLKRLGRTLEDGLVRAEADGLGASSVRRLVQAITDSPFTPPGSQLALSERERAVFDAVVDREALLGELGDDYPLVYVTGPDPRDVALTVSQINTHKIRGALTIVLAEDDPDLRQAASKAPAGNDAYRSVYVTLPRTRDTLMTVFSATVVLQRLALAMSELKAAWADRVGIPDHGVHPDVPKNVSKSITVD